mgnify:CR=1 FL=1
MRISKLLRKSISNDYHPVISYVEESMKQAAVEGIIKIGEQGGMLNEPYDGLEMDVSSNDVVKVAYGIKNNENLLKENYLKIMENELGQYVSKKISNLNFDNFTTQGFKIEKPDITQIISKAEILNNKIIFDIQYPMKITSGNTVSKDNYRIEINSELGLIHNEAVKLADKLIMKTANSWQVDFSDDDYDYTCLNKVRVFHIPNQPNDGFVVFSNDCNL